MGTTGKFSKYASRIDRRDASRKYYGDARVSREKEELKVFD